MSIEFLDPTNEESSKEYIIAPKLNSLKGMTVGIISNGKKGTFPFFDAFEENFLTDYGVSKIIRKIKTNYSAPADEEIIQEIPKWDAVITGLGD